MSSLLPSRDVTALLDLEHRLNLPTEDGSALPNAAYTSTEFFTLEQQMVFRNTWVFAGFAHQLVDKGDMLPVEIAGQPLVLVKGDDAVIRAFHNVCRHRGAKLVDQTQRGRKNFICPNHSWSYDLKGKLKARPHFHGGGKHEVNQQACHRGDWFVLFPNFAFEIFPDQVDVFYATPMAVNECKETIALYFVGEGAISDQYSKRESMLYRTGMI